MGKTKQHAKPTETTQKHILAASGNQCAFPSCSEQIFDLEHETLVGTIAHIKARSEKGPRFDPSQEEVENRAPSNLVAMCAKHSRVIDGPKAKDYSVEVLTQWKVEHEARIAADTDRAWLRPANSIARISPDGQRLHFSFWLDRTGRPRLYTRRQLVAVNVLTSLWLELQKVAGLPGNLAQARGAEIEALLQQSWARFEVEHSVLGDLLMRMAMVPNVTMAEFLAFAVEGNDPSPLLGSAAARFDKLVAGDDDPVVKKWSRSDPDRFE